MTSEQQLEIVRSAKERLDTDVHLANFMIRDLPITIETGNSDLAWAMHRAGALHKNDLSPTLNELEGCLVKKIEGEIEKQAEEYGPELAGDK